MNKTGSERGWTHGCTVLIFITIIVVVVVISISITTVPSGTAPTLWSEGHRRPNQSPSPGTELAREPHPVTTFNHLPGLRHVATPMLQGDWEKQGKRGGLWDLRRKPAMSPKGLSLDGPRAAPAHALQRRLLGAGHTGSSPPSEVLKEAMSHTALQAPSADTVL